MRDRRKKRVPFCKEIDLNGIIIELCFAFIAFGGEGHERHIVRSVNNCLFTRFI